MGLNEPHYMMATRICIRHNIKIYPIAINTAQYKLEINYKGWICELKEEYKKTPRYKKDKIWHKEVYKLYTIILIFESNKKMKNILEEAIRIVYERNTEKEKEYGPFHDSMRDAAKIMTILTGKHISTRDFYKAMISLKLSRLRHSDKHDTYLDAIAYIASMSELKSVKPLISKDFE